MVLPQLGALFMHRVHTTRMLSSRPAEPYGDICLTLNELRGVVRCQLEQRLPWILEDTLLIRQAFYLFTQSYPLKLQLSCR